MTSSTLQHVIKTHEDFLVAHQEGFQLFLPLLQLLARGKPVALEELANASHRSRQETQALLQQADIRMGHEGNIQAFGLSLVPAAHQFHLDEQSLSTWCALDVLAFPPFVSLDTCQDARS